jgi:hypothetical protein
MAILASKATMATWKDYIVLKKRFPSLLSLRVKQMSEGEHTLGRKMWVALRRWRHISRRSQIPWRREQFEDG